PPGINVHLPEVGDVQGLVEIVVERLQRPAPGVFEDVAVIHLDEVRRVAPGDLRGEPRPVIAPAGELAGDRHVGGDALVGLDRLEGAVRPLLRAPPQEAQARRLGPCRTATEGCERQGRRAAAKYTSPVERDRHSRVLPQDIPAGSGTGYRLFAVL